MTPLESASAAWNALQSRPECHAPIAPDSPMGGCMIRFDPDGRVVHVFGGTYSTFADNSALVREILAIQSAVAEECRKAVQAKALPAFTAPRKPSLDDLELEF